MSYVIIRPPPCALADKLRALPPEERTELASLIIREGLPDLLREGFPPGGVPDAQGSSPIRIPLPMPDYFDLRDAADTLKSTRSEVLRELIYAHQARDSREDLEREYIRRGHHGDPRRLSRAVLLLMLQKEPLTPNERALVDIAGKYDQLLRRLDRLEQKFDIFTARPTAAELQKMSIEELKEYLRSIRGRVPRRGTREIYLACIYQREQEMK